MIKMKTLIVCISVHHGNTQKVAESMAGALGADILKPQEVDEKTVSKYDFIGFGSGIFYFKHHAALLELVDRLPSLGKKAFVFSTSGAGSEKQHTTLRKKLSEKGFDIAGEFSCKGFDTWGPYKLTGGRNRGKPDKNDLDNARIFAEKLSKGD